MQINYATIRQLKAIRLNKQKSKFKKKSSNDRSINLSIVKLNKKKQSMIKKIHL